MSARFLVGDEVSRWHSDPQTQATLRHWIAVLKAHPTHASLRQSVDWPEIAEPLAQLMGTIQQGAPGEGPLRTPCASVPASDVVPADGSLRFVHWNILKGVAFDDLAHALGTHPDLAHADVILLNEVDLGMARSGNRHVAAELGAALGRHWIWAPCYLELTKGTGRDIEAPGENQLGLQGVAILCRRSPRAMELLHLPDCFDAFAFSEKRFGVRAGLLAALGDGLAVGTTHLEVRTGGGCRARQMRAFLDGVGAFDRAEYAAGRAVDRFVLSGDLNTHTFARHTLGRALLGCLRICLTSGAGLRTQLMEPWRGGREPLFAELRSAGFEWQSLNDRRPTACERLGNVEEWKLLPLGARRWLRQVLRLENRTIDLRLDWFAVRGVRPELARGWTVPLRQGDIPSDHDPLVLSLRPHA